MIFENRTAAGKQLADKFVKKFPNLQKNPAVIVLALPRGGIPVGFEIAKKLQAPFDLIVTHKLGAPGNEEFAIGAVAEDGSSFIDQNSARSVSRDYLKGEIHHQLQEIKKRIKKYRSGRSLPSLKDKIVILADDGVATGNTMKAAIKLAKNAKAQKIILAVPVIPADTLANLIKEAEVIFLDIPYPFLAIGRFYQFFEQLTDEEVLCYFGGNQGFPL